MAKTRIARGLATARIAENPGILDMGLLRLILFSLPRGGGGTGVLSTADPAVLVPQGGRPAVFRAFVFCLSFSLLHCSAGTGRG